MPIASTLDPLRSELDRVDYLADEGLAMALFLAMRLGRPLLLEGPSGVGKSAAATALAAALHTPLISLQCYEGIGAPEALYGWDRAKQELSIQLAETAPDRPLDATHEIEAALAPGLTALFAPEFLVDGPLLQAMRHDDEVPAVLLIDDVDRTDARFQALLVEFLDRRAVTVPEVGTFVAKVPPIVVITSNNSRPLGDALKRRCSYHWMEHPSAERATEIVGRRVEGAASSLLEAVVGFVADARALDLHQPPGLAEAIDWVTALTALGLAELDLDLARSTLGSLAKTPEDIATLVSALDDLHVSP